MQLKTILLKLRNTINEIDELILNLLSKRRKIAIKIAKKKIANNFPIKDKLREQELLHKLSHTGKSYQLPESYIKKIFHTIIEDSVMIQQKMKIKLTKNKIDKQTIFSFLGPKGSYSYIAGIKFITKHYNNYIIKEYNNFENIFSSIINRQSNYAIVPIENNTTGFIYEVYSLLCYKRLKIIGELILPIKHCLLTKPHTPLETIKNIYSHNQIFQQCSNFIRNFPNWNIKYTNSTSEAMVLLSRNNQNNVAAIGDQNNAKLYKLHIALKDLANKKNNNTRFLILSKKNHMISNITPRKTTILLQTKKISLFTIILLLHTKNIHILKIKSELNKKNKIKEIIYLEIKEHIKNENIKAILKILKQKNILIDILGCYPTFNIL